ncbi:Prolipoprotein diacylglyceryl transferase [Syntrophus gentianae]|uniref:Prolipoprotein diacylglyceryl transferase n=1 Tax=Syntrophus gentianae TaxID=43775 RepID=A0A1H7WVC8_9BACT|nr:prolipoprotein diacylglyceryl transferase family protein [Syntrophus gentianae]SEM25492.1 Prolipoprotein diacylglyceryl transferase [Syntrophus gentianae]
MDILSITFNYSILFVFLIGLFQSLFYPWAFRNLPKENWQVMACVPGKTGETGARDGINYTWYGFFLATAYVYGVFLFLLLMGSLVATKAASLTLIVLVLIICTPLSSILARGVEGKRFTLTVGGATFAGLLLAPWLIQFLNEMPYNFLNYRFPILPTMTAMAIAHIAGEGMGRLACISFGCCYGKPVRSLPPLLGKLIGPFSVVFSGKTKKISYAHGLDGHPVVPVQAMTAVLYSATSLLGIWLFLNQVYAAAFVIVIGVSQGWRILSEFLRADYRGERIFSVYQMMSLAALPYAIFLLFFFPQAPKGASGIELGFKSIWSPEMILFLQGLWSIIFFYTGKSRVTAAKILLYVVKNRI